MRQRITLLAVAAVASVALAACGGGDGDGGGDSAESITAVATEFEFDPADISIAADSAAEIVLDNQGAVEHDLTIDELDVEIYVEPGETNTGSITAGAGTYEIYCSIPGHREAGMEGTLTVG